MLCSPINFSCFHVNSDAETRSAETQQTQISGPVGLTEPPLSVSVSMSPSLSLMMPLFLFCSPSVYWLDKLQPESTGFTTKTGSSFTLSPLFSTIFSSCTAFL